MSRSDPAPPAAMVRVRLFASLREAAGWGERLVPLAANDDQSSCTPLLLWHQLELASHGPSASGLPSGLRVAINQCFALPDTPLSPGDELAFLPPITGG